MKKYVSLRCSTCERTRDSLVNLTHYAPDRCVITLGCEGRMYPVGYTSDGTTILGVPPEGLLNWYPRGSKTNELIQIKEDSLYELSTGSKRQVILAVKDLGVVPSATATVTLNTLAQQQVAKDYRQYIYRRTGTLLSVNGVEDGTGRKVLRYSLTDEVDVYVNGVKRTAGLGADQYQVFTGVGGAAPPNTIVFNTQLTGNTIQVDVIVSQAATPTVFALPFLRATNDEARAELGAWEGVDSVFDGVSKWYLFYLDFAEALQPTIDLKLKVQQSTMLDGVSYTVAPNQMKLLISRVNAYTSVDRLRAASVPLETISSDQRYLMVKKISGSGALTVVESAIAPVFPPFIVNRFSAPKLLRANLTGSVDAAEYESPIIVGPDT